MEMKFPTFYLIALLFLKISSLNASPGGAPQNDDVCLDMLPRHQAESQPHPAPFELSVSESNIKGGERLEITIRRTASDMFKGFLLQARTYNEFDESAFEIVGEFFAIQDDQSAAFNFRNCASRSHNCVTHANNSDKEIASFEWKAPYNYDGQIYFM